MLLFSVLSSLVLVPNILAAAPGNPIFLSTRQDEHVNGSIPTSDKFKAKLAEIITAAKPTPYTPPASGRQFTNYMAIGILIRLELAPK